MIQAYPYRGLLLYHVKKNEYYQETLNDEIYLIMCVMDDIITSTIVTGIIFLGLSNPIVTQKIG